MTELNDKSFNEMIEGDIPTVVDFWAGWCMPCKIFAPVIEQISEELDGAAEFGKLDIDEFQDLAIQYNVMSIPTLVIFKSGKETERMVGVQKKEDVISAIQKYI